MHRPTASYLLVALLAGAPFCLMAERLKVQVVQTHTGIKLGQGDPAQSATSDPSSTRCNRLSGAEKKDSALNRCGSAVSEDPAPSDRSDYMFFDISVVMPDATRAVFHCSTVLNETCEGFPEYPRNTSVVCSDFVVDGKAYKDCTASASTSDGIGVYKVALHGDRLTLFGPHWQRQYLKYGTWEYPDPMGQDPKTVRPQDTNIASAHDPKPATDQEPNRATGQDPKPVPTSDPSGAAAQDPQPTPSQEPKPAPPPQPPAAHDTQPATTQGSKSADPTESKPASTSGSAPEDHASAPAPQPVAVADLPVDPTVVEQAKAGDQVAQYKLGYDYYLGRGVALDYVQAAIWWRKSADQGYPAAQNNLGVLYNAGKGVPQSYEEAYFWQNLAAARASAGALQVQFAKNRDESASRLWLFERRRVQKRAAQWAADHPVPARSQEPRQAKQ